MYARDPASDGALAPAELSDRLEEILAARAHAPLAAALAADLAAAPITAERLVAAAGVLRGAASALPVPPNRVVLDVVDASAAAHPFVDVSVGAALLVAACDGTVAHQGAGPPRDGGAALLHALGIPVDLDARRARTALDWCGFAVLARRRFHPSLPRLFPVAAAAPRFFALLAPLLNPASPSRQLVGVDDPALTGPLLDALVECGADAALVVTSGGAPFLSPHAECVGHLWRDGTRGTFRHPGGSVGATSLATAGTVHDAQRLAAALGGVAEPYADAVALTAGAAMWVAGLLPTLTDGRVWAADRMSQGVSLSDLGAAETEAGAAGPTSPSRTAPAPAPTSPRSPRPPRAGGRRAPGRRG